MFLSDLRGQQVSRSFPVNAACSETASDPLHAGPDDHLIAVCRTLTSQIAGRFDGVQKASNAQAMEYEFLMASQRQADAQLFKLVGRVRDTRASTDCGMQWKHAVADLLMSLDCHNEPSPYRDALLLSFLRDAERLHYPVIANSDALAGKDLATTRAVIENGQTCLRVMEELTAGFTQWERGDDLSPAALEHLVASLSDLLKRKRELIAGLARSPAPFAPAVEAKRMVLQRLLELGSSDTHELRVNLARSYLNDLRACIQAGERGQELATGTGSLWSTISSKLRWLTSSVPHR